MSARTGHGLVTLVSNVAHSSHAAVALDRAGLLAEYWSPFLISDRQNALLWRALPRAVNQGRRFPGLISARHRTLVMGEAAFMSRRLFRRPSMRSLILATRLAELQVRARPIASPIVHFHAGALPTAAREWRRAGVFLVCDLRSVHPDAEPFDSPYHDMVRAELRVANVVLVTSEYAKQSLVDHGVDPASIAVLPLGVDRRHFPEASDAPRHGDVRALFVGALSDRKGVRVLAEAMRLLRDRPDMTFSFAGAAVEPYRSLLRSAHPNVEFQGVLDTQALAAQYRLADVLILPSLSDAYGLVVPEALSCGTPVMVTTACGASHLVHSGCGAVVPPGDPNAIAAKLREWSMSPGLLRSMRTAASAAATQADWGGYETRLVETYEQLILPRHAAGRHSCVR